MRTAAEFSSTVRRGIRVGRPTLLLHARRDPGVSQVGFVVSRSVGNAVRRNRVRRQLRHLVSARLRAGFDGEGLRVVVRALPPAADADSDRLDTDLQAAWSRLERRLEFR